MKKFAVGYLSFFENDLVVEIVEAENWGKALVNHSKLKSEDDTYLEEICVDGMKVAQGHAFDGDWIFDVKEINV